MGKAGLDGLLLFRQESMYWLTGYDTSGYSMFQGMYLRADGALALLTRSADLRQARLPTIARNESALAASQRRPATVNGLAGFVIREPDGSIDTIAFDVRIGLLQRSISRAIP